MKGNQMQLNPFKLLDRYFKLRIVRILRAEYLDEYTCVAIQQINHLYAKWYSGQVDSYAKERGVSRLVPFQALAFQNRSTESAERLKFLNQLESLVLEYKDE
jgi:hypothetical protein